jgi:hypothetical protein
MEDTASVPFATSTSAQHDTENIVQAETLPVDWNPMQADVIVIPEAAAVLIDEDVMPSSTSYIASAPREKDLLHHHSSSAPNELHAAPGRSSAVASTTAHPTAPSESLLDRSVPSNTIPLSESSILQQIQTIIVDSPENLAVILADSQWTAAVRNLDPREFCSLVKAAQPKTAPEIAKVLAGALGQQFECRYVVACIWSLPDETRMPVVNTIGSLASDLQTNRASIEQELRDYELVQFRMALVCA